MSRSARAALHVLGPVALAATLLAVPAHATPAPPAPRTEGPAVAPDHRKPLLADRVGGRAAVRQLGADLPVAAARNDMTPAGLEKLLTDDDTTRLDVDGRLHYVEPTLTETGHGPTADTEDSSAGSPATGASAPLADTFRLHSRPGASKVIFLDFDGGDVSGTVWQTQDGAQAMHPAWDPGRNGAAFSDSERQTVQQVWAMVAEDFAPWDVDVTTEDPGPGGLQRDGSGDDTYGSWVLITPSSQGQTAVCGGSCGGVAYINTFTSNPRYQPAWVFPQSLGNSAKSVAEAASHEVGHNLGLKHDGSSATKYYSGHGSWAPIMGVGYGKPIVQWSRGSYPGADNVQDDLRTIDSHLSRRTDEAGSTPGTAVTPSAARGVISSTGDVDTYALGSCTAGATVAAPTAAVSPNLDLELVLSDASGSVLGRHNPSHSATDGVTGVTPTVTLAQARSQVYASVRGTGLGTWSSEGYDNYASLGVYTLAIGGCDATGVSIPTPGVPRGVAARRGDGHATVTWQPPASGGPVGAYRVITGSGQTMATVSGGSTAATVRGLRNGTSYRFSVVAANTAGASPASAPTATVVPAGVPDRVARPAARARGRRLALRWRAPSANGAAIRRYQVKVRGPRTLKLRTTGRRAVLRGLPRGRYRVRVMAVNEVGRSAWSPVRRQRLTR